ncbi:putative Nucleoside recognition protein [Vibrio nigripulchritudo SO65]|uniref:YjiH family protein n=1 Tax=Vibrio nigripulchritudo TaxID=28173 RepID=UPI0003B1FA86|nr:YjiH family protein [Vibrio nigripulchritudo]CCN38306.1 putative Nucleoside recognition protein [Vibrio nigripulchritudo AM115]CCN43451.1 putative Nucleoside recognition protein [Vibrio nigripulchritudo FTn2]CCN65760.1 putative Nucleoside recognition protein [Vibrio nigripulchritudo POn4]CCN75306.1 putative Nucleoside recognition protein [Vibrio nigripulchritudo SO65]
MNRVSESSPTNYYPWFRLIGLSAIGIFIFFVPVTFNDKQSIPLDHMTTFLKTNMGVGAAWYAVAMIIAGAAYPLVTGSWKKSTTEKVFLFLKCLGVIAAIMAVTKSGPAILQEPDMLPFLFNKLVISVGLIVPIGSIFLAFLVSYGLLEAIGILLQKLMQPIWKTPGRSAIDAVASFVGSYSIGLLITNRVYIAGHYSARESAIIATGFSTVSATFMIIVAKTLGLMSVWNQYFWITLLITFVVTAITVRLPPLSRINNDAEHREPNAITTSRLKVAIENGLSVAEKAPPIGRNILDNFKDGLVMTISILPSIMSVGVIGLLAAKYTPVFDWIGYLFYPVTLIWGIEDGMQLARASASGLAEMFLPALLMKEADIIARFTAGVVCVSSILFFSASIPCILATKIPLTILQLVSIWFIRTFLSLMLAIPTALLLFG